MDRGEVKAGLCIFPGGAVAKNLPVQETQRHKFDPWVGKMAGSRKWQPTPVLFGKFHGQRSLASYSPQGHKELTAQHMGKPAPVIIPKGTRSSGL